MGKVKKELTVEDFYFLKIGNMWRYFKKEHFSFWMICGYLIIEYGRPQMIYPPLDFLPWGKVFLIGSLIGAILDPSVRWVSSPINKAISLFAIAIFIASYLAYRPDISWEKYFSFYGWFVIYFLILNIINNRERFYIFVVLFLVLSGKIAIGTSLIWASRGFTFAGWGLTGPPGNFQNSGELAILMLTLFPVSYYLLAALYKRVTLWERLVLVAVTVAPIMTVIGASSRGAQLALLVQLIVMFYKSLFKFKRLIGLILASYLLFSLLPEEQMKRFESSGDDQTSVQRLLYWKHGIEMIREYPYFGVGFYNFVPYYNDYFIQDALNGRAQLPHNILIQVGTDAGIIGLVLFSFLLLYPFYIFYKFNKCMDCSKITKVVLRGFIIGNLGFIVAGQFVTVAYYPFLWIGLSFIVSGVSIEKKCCMYKKCEAVSSVV